MWSSTLSAGLAQLLFWCTCVLAGQTQSADPEKAPSDKASFQLARAQEDPARRVAALEQFLASHPGSDQKHRAESLLLQTYLEHFPARTAAMHHVALVLIQQAPAGLERWAEQSRIAGMLAAADPDGADRDHAQQWAQQSVDALTEVSYRHEMTRAQARYRLPALTRMQLHTEYTRYRASFLTVLAQTELRTDGLNKADMDAAEAYRLDPRSGEVNSLLGELASARHRDGQALEYFETAEARGALRPRLQAEMVTLYKRLHGDPTGLEAEVDRRYETINPPLFVLPKRRLPQGGHTVLLELFTGSGCLPCVAPDLAVESLLATYTPADLAVLEFDEHIPRPDPLTNPESEARGASYGIQSTPEAFLDGEPLQVLGASRDDLENVVVGFAQAIEDRAAQPSPFRLALEASQTSADSVHASVSVQLAPAREASAAGQGPSFRTLSAAVLRVALVQDHIRYSGENGVRFHRMVVRALDETPVAAHLGSTAQPYSVRYNLQDLERRLRLYLDEYERSNDRFGPIRFATKDFPLHDLTLGLVAWVQDPKTREVYQSAFAPVR